jgi:hypothetical protein
MAASNLENKLSLDLGAVKRRYTILSITTIDVTEKMMLRISALSTYSVKK